METRMLYVSVSANALAPWETGTDTETHNNSAALRKCILKSNLNQLLQNAPVCVCGCVRGRESVKQYL